MTKFTDNARKLKNSQILAIIIACLIFLAIISSITFAWLMDDSTTSNGDPDITLIGDLDLDVTTNFKFKNLALAPDTTYVVDQDGNDIATYIKTSDSHDIDGAYVRIKYETTRRNVGDTDYIDNLDLLQLYFVDNYTTSTTYDNSSRNKWVYNATDNFYYYLGGVYGNNVMFNRGYKTTNIMTNVVANADITITLTVDSIQRQYGASDAVWTTSPQVFKDMVAEESSHNGLLFAPVVNGKTVDVQLEAGLTISQSLAKSGLSNTYTNNNTCGWYADADCTIPVDMNAEYKTGTRLYTKTATLDQLDIEMVNGKKTLKSLKNSNYSGELVIPNDIEILGERALLSGHFKSLVIPNSVTTIENLAIHDIYCNGLHIPKSVVNINEYAGTGRNLSSITVAPDNPRYTDGGGVLYNR